MRLTNTGLGIGTSSTGGAKLAVAAASADYFSPQIVLGEAPTATSKNLWIGYNTTANKGYIQAIHNNTGYTDLILQPNGANLGLGVVPSAWHPSTKAIDISVGGAVWGSSVAFGVATALYGNASDDRR